MIIDCISDLHGCKLALQGGDLLIVSGDLTARDSDKEHLDFIEWLALMSVNDRKYKKTIYIAGNHDGFLDPKTKRHGEIKTPEEWGIDYLCDSGTEFQGLKIWGSPWTPTYHNWNFMKERGEEIKQKWDLIPDDTDILITHGPPWGVLDETPNGNSGCEELRIALERVKPRLMVFGHIHENGGKQILFKHSGKNTICVNASIMNERYKPLNLPIRIII